MTQGKIFVVEGPIFFCCFSAVFDTLFALIIKYPLTRALIQREYRNRYYQVAPYFFSGLIIPVLMPLMLFSGFFLPYEVTFIQTAL